jgi:hypothetical protein
VAGTIAASVAGLAVHTITATDGAGTPQAAQLNLAGNSAGTARASAAAQAAQVNLAGNPAASGTAATSAATHAAPVNAAGNPAPTPGTQVAGATAGTCSGVSVGPAQQVVSSAVRAQLKVGAWPDTAFGVLRDASGGYRFLSTNGLPAPKQVITTKGTLANPVSGGVMSALPVAGVPAGFSYAGGGPVYSDPGTGMVLQVVHMERALPNNGFWTELDLGVLNQATGQTTRLGAIVQPGLTFAQAQAHGISFDLGVSSLSVIDGYIYVYFPDLWLTSSGTTQATGLSVARAPLADVLAAAASGTVTKWMKYGPAGWTVPALGGGASADVNLGATLAQHPDVIRSSALGTSVMVGAVSATEMDLTSSADGIHWTARVPLFRDSAAFADLYPTLVGEGANPADPGTSFYLYYTQFASDRDWASAHVMRRQITCTSGLPASTVPLVRYYNGTRHEVTAGPSDPGYREEGRWYLLSTAQPGTVPLYGCLDGALLVDQFISGNANCEASQNPIQQTEGWIYTARPSAPSTPLYRCHVPGLGDHFVSILANCEGSQYVNEGLLGYALTTS